MALEVLHMSTEPIKIRSLGPTALEVVIRGHRLVLDQPPEALGTDEGPTPTELFVASLAACSVHYARSYLGKHGHEEVAADCSFRTSEDRPHRVTEVDLMLELPAHLGEDRLVAALRAASHCTVHNSLAQPPLTRLDYRRAEEAVEAPALGRAPEGG